ncbi:MAG: hypothetical protein L0H10_21090 [Comamonas sp.]|uniref:hypothetical protein n=1 Tax=Comamonas TaxID=283 RepID=UPI0023AAB27B|nr:MULTISPECIES: hypothetical protein [Comamonas]MDN5506293.1 hypothetical protein [Comamonas sp.]MDN5539424.1 hypothetical protein [Comamonas sp.]WEE76473.1 hypothetical protein LZ683_20335 [Comamonas testosteroni]
MSNLVFTRRMDANARCVLSSDATLSDGRYLAINAARHTGLVELGLSYSSDLASHQTFMAFTPEQARAVAAELLACADAHAPSAMQGGVQ